MNFIQRFLGKFRPYNGVKTPIVLQQSETECGIAVLASMFAYYKLHIPLEELRSKCGASRDGCKAITLTKIAENYGFETEAYSMDIDGICLLAEPVIAFWGFSHYVIINGAGYQRVFINDPGQGTYAVSMKDFDKLFTGIIIRLIPTSRLPKVEKKYMIFPFIREWITGFYLENLFLLACFLLAVCWPLIFSALSNVYINYCVISEYLDWIPYIITYTCIGSIVFLSLKFLTKWTEFKLIAKSSLLKSTKMLHHLLHLPLIYFSIRQKSEIIANIARVEYIINSLYRYINTIIGNAIIVLFTFTCMLLINVKLSLITFILTLISYTVTIAITKYNLNYEKSNVINSGKLYANSLSWIKNIETIKACGLEESIMKKWHCLFVRKINIYTKIWFMNSILNISNKVIDNLSNLAILYIGAIDITNGYISIGSFMSYVMLHIFHCSTANSLFHAIRDSLNAYASHIRVKDVFIHPIDSRFTGNDKKSKTEVVGADYVLSCQGINFHYNKNDNATLNKISLTIKPGEHIALVGATGSGKSTLAKVLCALYQPDNGNVLLYGKNIISYSSDELISIFSYVSQETSLFPGTIYENLIFGRGSIEPSKIENTIKIACLNELISTRGLYAKVEEGGSNFSGGEKQRIDIARAIIQDTPIMVLDEATSALDVTTEANLIKNLRMLNKTIIFVAHRLSTIQYCDQIIVMENGYIKEVGNHSDLIKNEYIYHKLVSSVCF